MTVSHVLPQERPWSSSMKALLAALLLLWLAAAYALGVTEVLTTDGLQPFRPVLLTILVPLGLFLAAAGSARFRAFVLALDIRQLTMLQHWRVIGFAFLPLTAFGVLPGLFAWPAGLGDVAIGLAAPFVVTALARRPDFAESRRFLAFHLLGILDFVVAAGAATLSSGAVPALHAGPLTSAAMEVWPLSIFPTFIVPLFLMAHLAVLFQALAGRPVSVQAPATVAAIE
ncbi:MAG: hypothetical protein OEU56_19900 [Rhodospirillales bacterium]|nr:hypothetical protein [Rhodospirillales bacterium]